MRNLALLLLLSLPAMAGEIPIEWDPNAEEHPSVDVYKIFWEKAGDIQQDATVPKGTLAYTVTGLEHCADYDMWVRACDSTVLPDWNCSDRSNMLTGWARPDLNTMDPTEIFQGQSGTLRITGGGFTDGFVFLFEAGSTDVTEHVSVSNVRPNGCTELLVEVAVSPAAPAGVVLDLEYVRSKTDSCIEGGEPLNAFRMAPNALQIQLVPIPALKSWRIDLKEP
jgi:hypothetical protein